MSLILVLVIVLLVLAFSGVFYAVPTYGPVGWSPLAVLLVVLVILWLAGVLR